MPGQRGQPLHVFIQRVARHIKPEDFFFCRQALRFGPFGHIGHFQGRWGRSVNAADEQAVLSAFGFPAAFLPNFHGAVQHGQQLRAPRAQRIECPCLFGKLAQALEYGARTFQVEANFDQILALVRQLAERLGIYLLIRQIVAFRIEGQKTIMVEMMDQRDWACAHGGAAGRESGQHVGVRQSLAGTESARPDRPLRPAHWR